MGEKENALGVRFGEGEFRNSRPGVVAGGYQPGPKSILILDNNVEY